MHTLARELVSATSRVAVLLGVLSAACTAAPSGPQRAAIGATPSSAPSPWSEPPTVVFASPDPHTERVSLARILADPTAMDGKPVAVGGYLRLEFEGNHFCLHKDDVDYLVSTNCVWLYLPDRPDLKVFSERYVAVRGVVNARDKGHMGMLQASIDHVTEIGALPERRALWEHLKGESR